METQEWTIDKERNSITESYSCGRNNWEKKIQTYSESYVGFSYGRAYNQKGNLCHKATSDSILFNWHFFTRMPREVYVLSMLLLLLLVLIFQTFGIVLLRPKTADSKTNEILWRGIPWHFCNSKAQNFLMRRPLNKKDVYATLRWCTKARRKRRKKPHSAFFLPSNYYYYSGTSHSDTSSVGWNKDSDFYKPSRSVFGGERKEGMFWHPCWVVCNSHPIPILFMCLLQIWQILVVIVVGKGFINYSFFRIQTSGGEGFKAPYAILFLYRFTFSTLISRFICAIDLKIL